MIESSCGHSDEKIISLVENDPAKAAQIIHELIHSTESNKEIA